MTTLADAHIEAQARLRRAAAAAVAAIWAELPGLDAKDVPTFLTAAVPAVTAAQRASVAVTSAYVARKLGRQPLPLDATDVLHQLRGGISPTEVYRRPFVTVWSALGSGTRWEEASAEGLARATSTAAMDVQLAMRQTLVSVGQADHRILGYRRVPDAGACPFCLLVSGQRYRTDQLMPIHNHCGCSVDVITAENRGDFTGNAENDLSVTRDGVTAAVKEHGELGPLLVNGDDHFTAL